MVSVPFRGNVLKIDLVTRLYEMVDFSVSVPFRGNVLKIQYIGVPVHKTGMEFPSPFGAMF